ncbi:hypothetical protein DERF_013944 [Dermatophagoides farinae]|uniref:Uncharacterized protein n=1 Tax=Dermatophagoides farinae TaxID=6954 RepID=A0A922L132_DERFA|nr:uncharacterized protein LOC124499614 [Dermatophagoides farinae]KAH9498017.1 hypothetical protein DERF_013944 [Dermatophagoides farinae]
MLKLILIFLIGIAYATQTRIKIGSKSWAYQIDLNHGQQIRNEFSNEDGVTSGFYLFRNEQNQTKKLQYTIDPNRNQPDVEFDVINIANNDEMMADHNQSGCVRPNANLTFDSIDSNEDFKGHVTLKVGNATYSINFATGDKSNSREEILTPTGLLYGRYNFMPKNSQNKIVINYKFNSTSVDPTFEVSLFKSSELETISRDYHPRERDYYHHNNINYNPNRAPYQRGYLPATSSSSSSSGTSAAAVAGVLSSSHRAAIARAQEQARQAALAEKYRNNKNPQFQYHDSLSTTIPSWYYNRSKSNEP